MLLQVLRLCDMVVARSARLLVVVLAAILKATGRDAADGPPTIIAIDGGMYEKYPQYRCAHV